MAKSIDLVWITVSNFDQAVQFYAEVVGLKLLEKNDEWKWAELQGETGARLGIGAACQENGAVPGNNGVITITVDDLDHSKKELIEKGAIALGDECEVPGHVKMQLFKDADGNQFHIVQHLYRAQDGFLNQGSSRQRKIDPNERDHCTPCKASEEGRFYEAVASPDSKNHPARGIHATL